MTNITTQAEFDTTLAEIEAKWGKNNDEFSREVRRREIAKARDLYLPYKAAAFATKHARLIIAVTVVQFTLAILSTIIYATTFIMLLLVLFAIQSWAVFAASVGVSLIALALNVFGLKPLATRFEPYQEAVTTQLRAAKRK